MRSFFDYDCFVSVILPVFNAEKTIKNTLNSIFAQNYEFFEVIAVDDFSTDNTLNILEQYLNDNRLILVKNKQNLGAAESRNIAINISKGRYVAFIDSDDTWAPSKLRDQVDFMRTNHCPVSCTGYDRYVDGTFDKNIMPPKYITYELMLSSSHVGLPTAMVDFGKTGKKYFRSIRAREDYVYWLDLFREGLWAGGLQKTLCDYTIKKELSHKIRLLQKHWWVFRDIEKFNLLKSASHISKYILQGVIKTYL